MRHSPPPPSPKHSHTHIWVWIGLALVAAGLVAVVWWRVHTANALALAGAKAAPPVPVVVTQARIADMPIYLPELGNVQAFYTVTVRTRVDGNLDKVAFEEGQIVQKGQLIAEIDPRPFQAAVEQAQGNLAKDQATLENAKLDLNRYTQAAAGTFTDQQIATQKALVDQDQGNVESDQGTLDNAKVQLAYCTITSPITGRIGLRQVDPGNYVQSTDTNGLAVITQIQPITVVFSIAGEDISKVMGHSATAPPLEADAYSSDFSQKLAVGHLLAVDSQINPQTDKLLLKAVYDNKDNALFPSQFVNVQLLVRTVKDAVVVPSAAVQRGPDNSTFVYVIKTQPGADGQPPVQTADVRNVTLGPTSGDTQVVRDGLSSGETVVVDGVDKLLQDSKVKATQAPSDQAATQPSSGQHHHHHQSQDDSAGAGATTRTDE